MFGANLGNAVAVGPQQGWVVPAFDHMNIEAGMLLVALEAAADR